MFRRYSWKHRSTSPATELPPRASLSTQVLAEQNHGFRGTGGVSAENRDLCFRPAFLDQGTGTTYLSRFGDGRIAPLHVLDGLPNELVSERDASGRVMAVKNSVIAGFLRDGLFFTREQAAKAVAHNSVSSTSRSVAARVM